MMMKVLATVWLLVVGPSTAFSNLHYTTNNNNRAGKTTTSLAATSYLDQLSRSGFSAPAPFAPAPASFAPAPASFAPPSAPPAVSATDHVYAPAEYFSLDNLAAKGPRSAADWGQPHDTSRQLVDDGTFSVGSWWCSEGGWPSPSPKGATEIFYVISGYGSLGDADGMTHYFGPGDTVIIPKGHTGRWDVNVALHKIWAVNDHARVEERATPIRVQVIHYNEFTPQELMTSQKDPTSSFKTCYDVGPTKVGVWASKPGSYNVTAKPIRTFFHVLEGILFVTDGATGLAHRCVAGDTVMMPAGWYGHIDVVENAKKLWTTADV